MSSNHLCAAENTLVSREGSFKTSYVDNSSCNNLCQKDEACIQSTELCFLPPCKSVYSCQKIDELNCNTKEPCPQYYSCLSTPPNKYGTCSKNKKSEEVTNCTLKKYDLEFSENCNTLKTNLINTGCSSGTITANNTENGMDCKITSFNCQKSIQNETCQSGFKIKALTNEINICKKINDNKLKKESYDITNSVDCSNTRKMLDKNLCQTNYSGFEISKKNLSIKCRFTSPNCYKKKESNCKTGDTINKNNKTLCVTR